VGSALASALTDAGHDVVVAASNAEKAEQAAAGLECEPAASPSDAADGADAVILAIPVTAVEEVAGEIRQQVPGKPVVDVTNSQAVLETGVSNAEQIQGLLPEAHVVKAFNTVFASNLGHPQGGERLDGFLAGDDANARARAAGCRRSEDGASAGGHGLGQHFAEHGQWLAVEVGLEAGALTTCPSPA
jgi:predicted dinucleotide-binding enzyme